MTQAALARAAGVSERNIIRWENNQHSPRIKYVEAIAQATGKPVTFFVVPDEPSSDDDEELASMANDLAFALVPFLRARKAVA